MARPCLRPDPWPSVQSDGPPHRSQAPIPVRYASVDTAI
jgi:hypothetical protein